MNSTPTTFAARFDAARLDFAAARERLQTAAAVFHNGAGGELVKLKAALQDIKARRDATRSEEAEHEAAFKQLFAAANCQVTKEARRSLQLKSEAQLIAGEMDNHIQSLEAEMLALRLDASITFDAYDRAFRNALECRSQLLIMTALDKCKDDIGHALANVPSDFGIGRSNENVAIFGTFKETTMKWLTKELEAIAREYKTTRGTFDEDFALPKFDRAGLDEADYLSPVMRKIARAEVATA